MILRNRRIDTWFEETDELIHDLKKQTNWHMIWRNRRGTVTMYVSPPSSLQKKRKYVYAVFPLPVFKKKRKCVYPVSPLHLFKNKRKCQCVIMRLSEHPSHAVFNNMSSHKSVVRADTSGSPKQAAENVPHQLRTTKTHHGLVHPFWSWLVDPCDFNVTADRCYELNNKIYRNRRGIGHRAYERKEAKVPSMQSWS